MSPLARLALGVLGVLAFAALLLILGWFVMSETIPCYPTTEGYTR